MDIELHKQRRSLVGVSLALVVYEIAGGTVKEVPFLGGGITLTDAKSVVLLAYVALAYFLWRYWLYARPEHVRFREIFDQTIKDSKKYQQIVNPLIMQFKDKSGVAYAEGWRKTTEDDSKKEILPIPLDVSIASSLFGRKLVIRVDNPRGDFNPDNEIFEVPVMAYEAVRFRALISVIVGDKTFSDLFIPYLLAFVAVGMHWYRLILYS